jgi:hypothetical protein
MAKMTRKLQFTGSVMSSPAAATVLLNGVELYSGQIGVGQPIDVPGVELFVLEYQGEETVEETVAVTISITSGVAKIATTQTEVQGEGGTGVEWALPWGNGNDGRTQILINGLPPEWPPTPVTPMPGGTPENPDWSGWAFDVSAGETITFEYLVLPYMRVPTVTE